jgi:hypothetical protein
MAVDMLYTSTAIQPKSIQSKNIAHFIASMLRTEPIAASMQTTAAIARPKVSLLPVCPLPDGPAGGTAGTPAATGGFFGGAALPPPVGGIGGSLTTSEGLPVKGILTVNFFSTGGGAAGGPLPLGTLLSSLMLLLSAALRLCFSSNTVLLAGTYAHYHQVASDLLFQYLKQ